MPNVRLILILRNPIDRAWSEALMTLVRDSGKRFSDIPTRVIYNKLDAVTIHYSVVIEKWLEFFSASQLHICFYEQIKQNPEILLRGVFQHIQVGTDIDYEELNMEEVINVGTGIEMPSKYRKHLIDTYRDEIHKMSRLWGAPIQPWLDDISNQAAQ